LFREFVNKKSLHERRIYDGLFYMNEDGTILTKFTAQELGEFDLEQLLQTLRKRAEEALRESEARLLTLINATPDIICFKDARGAWILANSSILDLYQIKGVDYQDKTEFELADPYGADLSECLQNLL
jgi:PAS domain-containing protein